MSIRSAIFGFAKVDVKLMSSCPLLVGLTFITSAVIFFSMISDPILLSMRLRRTYSYAVCVVGDFYIFGPDGPGDGIHWRSLELPLRDYSLPTIDTNPPQYATNVPGKCCIPANVNGDKYQVVLQWSPKHGRLLPHVLNVPGREAIEMHPASRPSDLLGCVAIGKTWIGVEPESREEVVIMGSQRAFYEEFEPLYLKAAGLSADQVTSERARVMAPVPIGTLEITNDFLNPPV
jgi:Family of unknown function (DUF5675)